MKVIRPFYVSLRCFYIFLISAKFGGQKWFKICFQSKIVYGFPVIDFKPFELLRSHTQLFCKKDVLKSFAKFTSKRLCRILFYNKVPGWIPAIFLRNVLRSRCFPVSFTTFLRKLFFRTPPSDCLWTFYRKSSKHLCA